MGDSSKIGTIFQHPRQLPGKAKWGSYVYILLFRDGLLKVGLTAQPAKRIETHRGHAEGYGNPIVKGWLSPWHDNGIENEKELISRATYWATSVNRAEYFVGVEFEQLVRFAARLPFTPVDVAACEARAEEQRKQPGLFGHVPIDEAVMLAPPVRCNADGEDQPESTMGLDPAYKHFRDLAGSWFGRNGINYRPGPSKCSPLPWALIEQMAEAHECDTETVLDMTYLDLIRDSLIAMVETEHSLARIYAAENGRRDLVRTIGEGLAEAASQAEA